LARHTPCTTSIHPKPECNTSLQAVAAAVDVLAAGLVAAAVAVAEVAVAVAVAAVAAVEVAVAVARGTAIYTQPLSRIGGEYLSIR
jgi:hypothetical protein